MGTFELASQQAVRSRLAEAFRVFVAQRLVPKKDGGRIAVIEMLKSTLRTREYMENGGQEGKTLLGNLRLQMSDVPNEASPFTA